MSRKKQAEHEESSSERWLVSYSDFITLLMVMFVILYSMGQTDLKKFKEMATSMRDAFSFGGSAVKIVDAEIDTTGGEQSDGDPDPIVIPGLPKSPPKSEEVAGQLTQMLQENNLGSDVSVQTNVEGVLISMSEKLTFDPGTAELQDQAYPVLDTIITMLKPIENQVRIIGHTDNTPSIDPRYPSNWELSLARAYVIAHYMIGTGIAPERLTVSGRGEFQPVFDNDTTEHKALNSRADIMVVYKVDSDIITVDSFQMIIP